MTLITPVAGSAVLVPGQGSGSFLPTGLVDEAVSVSNLPSGPVPGCELGAHILPGTRAPGA